MKSAVKALSDWYLTHARPLPWRETHDPYFIWISEIMLQQTQVATVIPYFEKFLKRFPSLRALAAAPVEDVLSAWSGLGYYSRARNLHRGAKYLVEAHQGQFPKTREEILQVPGIGPYTAGAVLSIAYDLKEPLVDGNVIRVFARYFGVREPVHTSVAQKLFWAKAREWVTLAESPRVLNQALMELGAIICSKGKPACEQCPLRTHCVAYAKGWQLELPVKKERTKAVDLWWVGLIFQSGDEIYLHKNSAGEWWSDLWDFPRVEVKSRSHLHAAIPDLLPTLPPLESWEELDHQKHTVIHHRIHVAPYLLRLRRKSRGLPAEGRWFPVSALEAMPISSLVRKMLRSRAVLQ